jgi:predicted nucleic acid-binding protein
MIVLDASVIVDAFIKPRRRKQDELLKQQLERHKKAKSLLKFFLDITLPIYIPRICIIETAGVIRRKAGIYPDKVINFIMKRFKVIDEVNIWDLALSIAKETGCRAVDSYYIATAEKTNSILITADKKMYNVATKRNIASILID